MSNLPGAAIPYTIDPVFSTGPSWTDGSSVTLSQQYANPWGAYYMMDYGEWDAAFNISSIPSSATVSSVSVNDSGMWAQLVNAGGSGTACMGGTPGSWSLPSGGQNLSQIPGQSTLNYSFGLQMGWYDNGSPYFCTWSITGIGSLSLTVNYTVAQPLSITTSSLPPGGVGTAYSTTLAATGGSGSYSWSIASGGLPAGLTLSSSGVISGTPTSGGAPSITFRVTDTSSNTATAQFTLTIAAVTWISTYPVGLTVTVDGVATPCNPYCSYYWAPGSGHSIGASTQPGNMGTQWVWASWSDGGAATHNITAGTSGGSYTANFSPQYYFTALVSPAGAGTISPASGWYNAGATFWATATPNVGWQLSSFSPGGAVPSYDVAMNGPVTLTANFTPFTGQTIASNPPGAAFTVDGAGCNAPCSFTWAIGSQHTVSTTSPQSVGSGTQLVFAHWWDGTTGSSDTITAAAGTTYTVTFTAQYYLTTAVSPSGGGTVSPPSGWYNSGTQVTLSASANGGYQFTNFTGTATGGSGLIVTMNGPATETANFAVAGGFTLTATPSDQTVAAGGSAAYTIAAQATSGFSGQIALTASSDSDVVPAFNPSSIPANGSSTVTLTSSSSDSFDLTTCTVTGTSGSPIGRFPVTLRLLVPVTIAITPTGVGLVATADGGPQNGIAQVAPIHILWRAGSTHTISVASPQMGTDGREYIFVSWSDGGLISHTVTPSHGRPTYTATLTSAPTEPVLGQPVYQAPATFAPVPTPPDPVSQSAELCNDIGGTWSLPDTVESMTLSQFGNAVTGSAVGYDSSCPAGLNYSISGTMTSLGQFSLAGQNDLTDNCGNVVPSVPETTSVTITSCSTLTTTTSGSTGTAESLFPRAGRQPTTTTWTGRSVPPGISLTVDIMAGKLSTQLSGPKTDNLVLAFNGPQGNQMFSESHGSAGSQTFTDTFRTQLPVGQYSSVTATWGTTGSATAQVSFYMLGLTHFTQYNTPYHSQCPSNPNFVWVINKMDSQYCYYQGYEMGSTFISQSGSAANATGVDDVDAPAPGMILMAYGTGATNICPLLPGTDANHTFWAVDSGGSQLRYIVGSHWSTNGSTALSDGTGTPSAFNNGNPAPGTVATDLRNTSQGTNLYIWGDPILIFDQNDNNDPRGLRSVQDRCGACSGQGQHIDMYNGTNTSCNPSLVGDYGSGQYYAIRLR